MNEKIDLKVKPKLILPLNNLDEMQVVKQSDSNPFGLSLY
ncbi:MAG: hypothetical protein ACFWT6_05940 [Virgibacillus proomii]|jgi:hypothetical protein